MNMSATPANPIVIATRNPGDENVHSPSPIPHGSGKESVE